MRDADDSRFSDVFVVAAEVYCVHVDSGCIGEPNLGMIRQVVLAAGDEDRPVIDGGLAMLELEARGQIQRGMDANYIQGSRVDEDLAGVGNLCFAVRIREKHDVAMLAGHVESKLPYLMMVQVGE